MPHRAVVIKRVWCWYKTDKRTNVRVENQSHIGWTLGVWHSPRVLGPRGKEAPAVCTVVGGELPSPSLQLACGWVETGLDTALNSTPTLAQPEGLNLMERSCPSRRPQAALSPALGEGICWTVSGTSARRPALLARLPGSTSISSIMADGRGRPGTSEAELRPGLALVGGPDGQGAWPVVCARC